MIYKQAFAAGDPDFSPLRLLFGSRPDGRPIVFVFIIQENRGSARAPAMGLLFN